MDEQSEIDLYTYAKLHITCTYLLESLYLEEFDSYVATLMNILSSQRKRMFSDSSTTLN